MTARADVLYPQTRFHGNPDIVVRLIYDGVLSDDWVFGVSRLITPTELEDGILNRACEIAGSSMMDSELSKIVARVVSPVTAQLYAEYQYDRESISFRQKP